MTRRKDQRGLGFVGAVFIFGLIGFFAIITIKTAPLYLNEMKVKRAIHQTAVDPENANMEPFDLRRRLQRRWDVEDIVMLQPKDVAIEPMKDGRRAFVYDYEARTNLFYNIYLVIKFNGSESLRVVRD
jgi:hypothetical protein